MQDSPALADQGSEKRRFPRVPSQVPVHYQVTRDNEWVQGQGHMEALDLGEGGLRIRVDQIIEEETSIYLQFLLADGPLFILARVVWSRPDSGGWVCGIAFQGLSEADRGRLAPLATPSPVA